MRAAALPGSARGGTLQYGGAARRGMAAALREFDASAALLGLYGDLPYVKKLGYSVGELGERILLRVIIDYTGDDEFFDNSMEAVRTARKFRDIMPAGMRDRYEVVPIVTDPYEGALWHFGTMTAVIDR